MKHVFHRYFERSDSMMKKKKNHYFQITKNWLSFSQKRKRTRKRKRKKNY